MSTSYSDPLRYRDPHDKWSEPHWSSYKQRAYEAIQSAQEELDRLRPEVHRAYEREDAARKRYMDMDIATVADFEEWERLRREYERLEHERKMLQDRSDWILERRRGWEEAFKKPSD